VGLLTLAHHSEGRYGSESSAITSTFASYAAVAIQNTRLFAKAQRDAWSSTVLLQVAEATQTIKNREELLATIVRLTPLLVGIKQCAIFLYDEETESYVLRKGYGFHPLDGKTRFSENADVAFLKLAATQKPVFVDDPITELGFSTQGTEADEGTVVLLPLMARGSLQGALLVTHSNLNELAVESPFDDETLALLQGIAQQTSMALENIQLLEMRQEEAYITEVLLQIAQAVVSQNDLNDILETIVHLVPILVGVDTCIFYLTDKSNQMFEPHNVIAGSHALEAAVKSHNIAFGEFELLDAVFERDVAMACSLDDPELPFDQWPQLSSITQIDDLSAPLPSGKNHWLVGFPLSIKGEVYGIMVTREANVPRAFYARRIELLTGVAQQVALAIQNDRFTSEMVVRERIDQEIRLAREIQETFLPNTLPRIEGIDLAVRWRTAREVGGDFYDAFLTKNHSLGVSIADVADKGLPAALYMTVTRTLIRSTSQSISTPGKVLERVNELLFDESRNGMFVTCIFTILDPKTGVLTYANAGHNLPLLLKKSTGNIETLPHGGIALGVVRNARYEEFKIPLDPGDELLLYTDGVTDAFSVTGESFSETRLRSAFQSASGSKSEAFLDSIDSSIDAFRKGVPPADDMTMVLLQMKQ
jgi:serine phosphatase RsbU (regulator of sigma subunit)